MLFTNVNRNDGGNVSISKLVNIQQFMYTLVPKYRHSALKYNRILISFLPTANFKQICIKCFLIGLLCRAHKINKNTRMSPECHRTTLPNVLYFTWLVLVLYLDLHLHPDLHSKYCQLRKLQLLWGRARIWDVRALEVGVRVSEKVSPFVKKSWLYYSTWWNLLITHIQT